MIDLGPHASFIIWAYGICLVMVLALIGVTFFTSRNAKNRIAQLTAQRLKSTQRQQPTQQEPTQTEESA